MPLEFAPAPAPPNASVLGPLLPAISSAAFVCFLSPSEELFDLVRPRIADQTPFAIFDGAAPPGCSHLVFLDVTAEEIVAKLAAVERLPWETRVIAVNWKTPLDLDRLEASSDVFKSAAVTVHHRNTTLALSSPFDRTREERYPSKVKRRFQPFEAVGDFSKSDDLRGHTVLSAWARRNFVECYVEARAHSTKNKKGLRHKPFDTVKYYGGIGKLYEELTRYLDFKDRVMYWFESYDLSLLKQCARARVNASLCRNEKYKSLGLVDVDVGFYWNDLVARDLPSGVGPAVTDARVTQLVRRPKSRPAGPLALLAVFKPGTWVLLGASFFVTACAYWLLGGRRETVSDVFFNLLGPLLLVGSTPRRSAPAMVLVAWSLFAIFNAAAFTSDLLDRVALPVYEPRVDSLADAVGTGYRRWDSTLQFMEILNTTGNSSESKKAYQDAKKRRMQNAMRDDERTMFLATRHDRDLVTLRFHQIQVAANEAGLLRGFRAMRQSELETFASINANVESAVRPAVNRGVQRLIETGIYDYHRRSAIKQRRVNRRFTYGRRVTVEEDQPEYVLEQLLAESLKLPQFILAASFLLSFCVLALEIICARWKNRGPVLT